MKFDFVEKLTQYFQKLPGVGAKTAMRYAMHIIENFDNKEVEDFAEELIKTKQTIIKCETCGFLTTKEKCEICEDKQRDQEKILVVKDIKEVITFEKTKQYNGLYHVLGGLISPLDGIGPDDLSIDKLEERIQKSGIKEVILATNFTPNGEITAMYITKILENIKDCKVSRIAFGLPAGGDIEYIDDLTLKRALEYRK